MAYKQKIIHTVLTPFRIFKIICFWIGFAVIALVSTASFLIFLFFHNLPDVDHMKFKDLRVQGGKVIQKHYKDHKKHLHWTSIDKINRDLIYTLVMAEDALFFQHSGIDYDAIINALFENVKADQIKYGASTISQQVAKNLFLDGEKSLVRKLKEYFITKDLEKHFTKNQIMEIYVNMAEFGPDIYGIEEASHYYFHKSPKNLNAAEGAFLALMLPSPRKYHYTLFQNHNFTKHLRSKYRRILQDMRYKEYISNKQYNKYLHYNFFTHKKGASS